MIHLLFGVFVAGTPRQTAVWKLWTKMEDTTLVSCNTHSFGKALSQMWEWQTLTDDVSPSKKVHADQNSNEKNININIHFSLWDTKGEVVYSIHAYLSH